MTEAAPDEQLPVADSLLVPLLDSAAAVLQLLDAADIPGVLRPLGGFDRRGLTSGPARLQLRRAVESDEGFRELVFQEFLGRPEVDAALETWSAPGALRRVDDAAERADLPLLASALFAARPDGWEFGLGVVCAAADRKRSDKERDDEARAREVQLANVDEARRRAEQARDDARADAHKLEQQLREERGTRRDRESKVEREAGRAEQRAREAEAAIAKAHAAAEMAESRLTREADRARDAERRLRELRRELTATESERSGAGRLGADQLAALAGAADRARELATELDGFVRAVRLAGSSSPAPSAPTSLGTAAAGAPVGSPPAPAAPLATGRRSVPICPPGMRADRPDALDAMLRTRGVVLVVDGYNVSMLAWRDAAVADQRDRLVAALAALHLKLRCDVVVVFDGADVEGVQLPRRPGVRVVFSSASEKADPLIVREAAAPGPDVPVIVATSDGWVHGEAERDGAVVVPAATLLEVLRR
jgi:predicted RNA-binding protein with PIN domain